MPERSAHRVPSWLKVAYSAFLAVLVPVYLANYGPTNFLYFCDIALFLTLVALWRESPLWASIPAVGILLPQMLWCVEFATGAVGWFPLGGMTRYMYDPSLPLHLRALSLFHGWLPWLLLWLVVRLGYDRRAFAWWWGIAWAAMLVCFFFMPATQDPDRPKRAWNINYVFGPGDAPQTWMPAWVWFALVLVGIPFVLALPSHAVLSRLPRRPAG